MKALVDYDRLLDTLDIEATVLAETVDDARPELRVPHAPGLTVGETARHVGSVYRMTLEWIRTGDSPASWQREPGPLQSLRDFVTSGARALVDELARHDPAEPCSTWWAADSTYGFWRRRVAHETAIHRGDVQEAVGQPVADVDDDIAVDGVDEILTLWLGHRLTVQGVVGARDGSVAVTTGDNAWLVRITTGGIAAWRVPLTELDRADAVVHGLPPKVYRWLWGRLPEGAVRKERSPEAINQMWALLRMATR
ncbi:maleylpyruvate isomerase N-terminal domain-containing protein [Actinocrispum wychmicini]|uniref:Uncharacterized protein (TIGR03083 family) n=1 Tax=Actinocrispum wychmicini TaxID=1213861 RepID=A0A4R2IUJ9_9PSEU|nr:maleylpyruvate isomerase N-terminal domain-containing protein [Actinocrispum wychmicini]TCO48126.1 uncharacterized protein (TIGR03083 family) [Actinocrispum wychmicini]